MIRSILVILVVVILAFAGYALYNRGTTTSFGTGEVLDRDGQKAHMQAGAVDVDGKPMDEAMPTPSRSDAPGTINTEPVAGGAQPAGSMPETYPPSTPGQTANPAAPGTTLSATPAAPFPVADTIAPNPPNGLAFGGTGKFQWYRQGDLTWRVDTGSGASCIAFATMDEWSKSIVYSHGCGTA